VSVPPRASASQARPDARLTAAIVAGQLTGALSRRLGRGGGTTLPGQVSQLVDRGSLTKLGAALRDGSVVVTGTNGKTTTTRLIASILRAAGRRVVHNRSGANLVSGVASALVGSAHPAGRVGGDVGLFEVDEASVAAVVAALRPRVLAVNNLFRDQLDRYGEVTYVARTWRRAVERLDGRSVLVLNADDPSVAALGRGAPGPVVYVGVDDLSQAGPRLEHTADARLCPICGGRLRYSAVFYGHVGHYACPDCGFARPRPGIAAGAVAPEAADRTRAALATPAGAIELSLPLPGLYNVYNALLALGVAHALGLSLAGAAATAGHFSAAFGRIERVAVDGRTAFLALVKNPVGFNQVLRSLLATEEGAHVLIAINDRLADGTDVSWLWDVDVDTLASRAGALTVSGTRAEDMLVRLKYGGVDPSRVALVRPLAAAFDRALAAVQPGGTLYVLPTYTAMLELRAELARRGLVAPFWED
jgi:UDP-N-acetylmuramyl tripeptide synthase